MHHYQPPLQLVVNEIVYFYYYYYWRMWILVPQLRDQPMSPAMEAWSLNHWPTREVPRPFTFKRLGGLHVGFDKASPGWQYILGNLM